MPDRLLEPFVEDEAEARKAHFLLTHVDRTISNAFATPTWGRRMHKGGPVSSLNLQRKCSVPAPT